MADIRATTNEENIRVNISQNVIKATVLSTGPAGADGSGSVWGGIGGTLSNQTDLQTALNAKAADSAVVHDTGDETVAGVKTLEDGLIVGDATTNSTASIKINSERTWTIKGGQSGATTSLDIQSDTDAKHLRILTANGSVVADITAHNTGTSGKFEIDAPTVINEGGANYDTRIEGDTDTTLFVADASADRIGIGTDTPQALLDVDGTARVTTLNIAGTDVTSSAAELNALDGITSTVTELNYTDGVTSAIQTQLDAKSTASKTETLTNKSLGAGVLQLAEGASIALDSALSADGTYSGITRAGTAGTTLAFGDLVYLQASDSRWELADADAASTAGDVLLGMCVLAAASDGSATTILLLGNIRADAAFPTLTIGAQAYVSTTAGDIQVAQPSGTDDVIRVVGFALTADELYFNPSQDYITHT